MNPRRAALAGIVFLVIAAVYFLFTNAVDPSRIDFAGITLLIALGAAMSLMAFVLFAGLKRS